MGRLWVAVAMMVALAGTALAKRDPACTCAVARVLPSPGSVDVPTNARLWRLPATSAPDQPIASYALAPHTHYEIRDGGTSFTTGSGTDDTPPIPPGIATVSIAVEKIVATSIERDDSSSVPDVRRQFPRPVALLHIAGTFDPDTAVVEVTLSQPGTVTTYYTTPDQLRICTPGFQLVPGPVDLEIVAIDLAGNRSSPATSTVTAFVDANQEPSCRPHVRESPLAMALVALMPVAIVLGLLVLLVVGARLSARAAVPVPMAIAAAESLARTVRLRALLLLAGFAAVVSTSVTTDAFLAIASVCSPVLVVIAYIALEATRALRLLRYDGVSAEAKAGNVEITVGKQRVTLRAPRWIVNRARYHGVPRATL